MAQSQHPDHTDALSQIVCRSDVLASVAGTLAGEVQALPDSIDAKGRLYEAVRRIQMGTDDLVAELARLDVTGCRQ